jgi:hypothetical protein
MAAIDPSATPAPAGGGNGAVWSLLLPAAERILCHAPGPAAWMLEAARRGVHVDVVTRCDAETWTRDGAMPPRLRCLWEPDRNVAYDLAVLWEPASAGALRSWLRAMQELPVPPRDIAVWGRNPWRGAKAIAWPRLDMSMRRAGWRLGAAYLALPEADRVRQLVEWRAWSRTELVQHRRTHRAWKSRVARAAWYRWLLPARLRRASLASVTPAPAVLETLVEDAGRRLGCRVDLERCLVSPNGVAIVFVRCRGTGIDQNAILKVPYVLAAEGRVARNASGLEWLAAHATALGRWSGVAPRLLARGSAGSWSYTLEERVAGSEAQAWPESEATGAMHALCGYLEALAQLGEAARPLDAAAFDRHVGAPIRRAARLLPPELAQRLHALEERLGAALAGVPVALVPRHGDFKLENVLGTPQALDRLRVLDWELWSPSGLPLVDLWHLLASRRARGAGLAMGLVVRDWLLPGAFSDTERGLVERLGRGLDPRYVAVSPWLYWLDRIGPIAARGRWPLPGWERANVVAVLEGFAADRTPVAVG